MRLRELNFPILIRYANELQAGRPARLHRPGDRFDWTLALAYEDGRFDNAEIIDSNGQAYSVTTIFFMHPTIWQKILDRLGNLLILPPLEKREIVRVDMELEPTRKLTFEKFKTEFKELILSHPAWWKRECPRAEMEALFSKAESFSDAFDEIGWLSPADNMIYRGKSEKIVDLRK